METKRPPPLPSRNFRLATTLNLFLPGSGLFYLGRRWPGALLAGTFLVCLVSSLGIFLTGYVQYLDLALGGQILEGDKLERVSEVFHPRWLIGLLLAGVAIYVASMVGLSLARRNLRKTADLARERCLHEFQDRTK